MATDSTRKENRDTPKEEWIPVGFEAIKEDK